MKLNSVKLNINCNKPIHTPTEGYEVKGNKNVVCFYIDFDKPMRVYASSVYKDETPVIYLEYSDPDIPVAEQVDMDIAIPQLKGYDYFCSSSGSKTMSICFRR